VDAGMPFVCRGFMAGGTQFRVRLYWHG
jgi:hypothetical protein